MNQQLLGAAVDSSIERATMWRVDSTAINSPIHAPSDSSLLLDGVRVMVRLLEAGQVLPGAPVLYWHKHSRRAKKRVRAIRYTRGQDKKQALYRDLIKLTQAALGYLEDSAARLNGSGAEVFKLMAWQAEGAHYTGLIRPVIDQTQRRVLDGERVPSADKIVSLFEPHTDIVVKDRRDVHYGHKLNLTSGRSGLIFDIVIEAGNPADAERFMPMLERHIERFGRVPRQVAADGGYAFKANLAAARAAGVKYVVFHKTRGLEVKDMARSPWVYRKLRHFRAGSRSGFHA